CCFQTREGEGSVSMPLLSRKVDYALLILAYLHREPGGGCARQISERFGLSRPFVANILKELCQKRFLTSHRGGRGGFGLAAAAAGHQSGGTYGGTRRIVRAHGMHGTRLRQELLFRKRLSHP